MNLKFLLFPLCLLTLMQTTSAQEKAANIKDMWEQKNDRNGARSSATSARSSSECTISDAAVNQVSDPFNGFFSDDDCASCIPSGQQTVADNFVAPKDGDISEICFNGGYFPNNINQTDAFTITFYSNNAGLPGAVIAGPMPLNLSSKATTGVILFGINEYSYQGSFNPVAVTAGTTYFVSIVNSTPGNIDSWAWITGAIDAVNGITGHGFSFEVPAVSWNPDPSVEQAFTLGYTEPVQAQELPNMSAKKLVFFGMSLLIVGLICFRRFA